MPVLQPAAADTTIEWYAEVYGDVAEGQVLTTRLDVLEARDGPVVTSTQGRVRGSPDRARRALTGQLDVSLLPPGEHLLRATLVVDGVTYKLSLLPSGVVRPGKLSIIGNGVVFDPHAFVAESGKLKAQGVEITPETLKIAENTALHSEK